MQIQEIMKQATLVAGINQFYQLLLVLLPLGYTSQTIPDSSLSSNHSSYKHQNIGCIVQQNQWTNHTWKLVWEDLFDNPKELLNYDEWAVEHETLFCSGNGIRQVSCNTNRTENVRVSKGYLVLTAQYESYFEHQYTAATITTKRRFSYGRYEFRAALPLGEFIRVSIFTRDDQESYWHESGQIDVMSNKQEAILYRGLHFANSTNRYQSADYIVSAANQIDTDLSKFHLYGIEWNENGLRFFYDTHFSNLFEFNQHDRSMKPSHQIRLQIGVGGILFGSMLPEEFTKLKWKCPAFVIDYVRIFKPVDNLNNPTELDASEHCFPPDGINENSTLDNADSETAERLQICLESIQGLPELTASKLITTTQLIILLIVIFLVLFVSISAYLFIQVNRVRRTVAESDQYGMRAQSGVYDQCQYDMYEYDLDKRSSGIYSTLTHANGNDYLEIRQDAKQQSQQEQTTNFINNNRDGATDPVYIGADNENNNNNNNDPHYLQMFNSGQTMPTSSDKPNQTNPLINSTRDTRD